jgi:hypothetical protein
MGSRDPVPGSDVDAPRSGTPDISLLLIVVLAALAVKYVVFGLSVGTSMNLTLPNAENWQDFSLAYMPAAYAFRAGFLPYNDFFYPYPPLFLYVLTAFSFLPLPSWSGAIPLVAADALTVVPLYLIARTLSGEKCAAGLCTAYPGPDEPVLCRLSLVEPSADHSVPYGLPLFPHWETL